MLELTDTQIGLLLSTYLWPLFRITGFLLADPLFGTKQVPRRIKTVLAISLTVLIAPLLPPMPAVPVVSGEGVFIIVQQLLIGAAMGFTMRLAITAVELSGAIIAMQMGLGFAMQFDPGSGAQVSSVSRLLTLFTYLILLAINGHHVRLGTLVESFTLLPVSLAPLPAMSLKMLAGWGGTMLALGLWLSLPLVAALLIVNLSVGVMTRAAPQFNIFSFGFPMTLTIGFVVLYLSIPLLGTALEQVYLQAFVLMRQLLLPQTGSAP